MDTFKNLIVFVLLGSFYSPSHAATYSPDFGELRVIDGDIHITRGNGTTSLMYPDAGLSKSIDVSTSKGNYPVAVEKSFPVVPSKVAKAATRFLKTLPAIGTAIILYDTVCDLTDICQNDGSLMQRSSPPYTPTSLPGCSGYVAVYPVDRYYGVPGSTLYHTLSYFGNNLPSGYTSVAQCMLPDKTLFRVGYKVVSSIPSASYRPLIESDWMASETKLATQPQQVAEALYNSDAPVPVDASTQSAPVDQQIAQTSTQTKDAQGNVTGTQVATTSVKVEDTSTASNVTYNVTETTTITNYNENNEVTSTQTSTSDNSPPKTPTDETTLSFDDVPPDELETEEVDLEMPDYESWGDGTCPDDVDLGVYGLSISYQPVCDTATNLKPFFLLLASITAVYILSGVTTKD